MSYYENKIKDIERIAGKIGENDGILNIDLAAVFEYSNWDVVNLGIDVLTYEDFTSFNDRQIQPFGDTVCNRRYPNKGWVTLSRKVGRRISKTGYPIVALIEKINNFKMIVVRFGVKEKTAYICLPIDVWLTKKEPLGVISIRLHDWEDNTERFGVDFSTHVMETDVIGLEKKYYIGEPLFKGQKDNMEKLNVFIGDRDDMICVDSNIQIFGQPLERFFI